MIFICDLKIDLIIYEPHNTLQEDQTIRPFAIFQKFLTLKLVLWAMEKFTFSSIQPISVKISGKYIYRKI